MTDVLIIRNCLADSLVECSLQSAGTGGNQDANLLLASLRSRDIYIMKVGVDMAAPEADATPEGESSRCPVQQEQADHDLKEQLELMTKDRNWHDKQGVRLKKRIELLESRLCQIGEIVLSNKEEG